MISLRIMLPIGLQVVHVCDGMINTIVVGIRDYLFWRSLSQLSRVVISYEKLIAVATQN